MTETPQSKIRELLGRAGIPAKEINCYGSQVVITAHCEDSARRWFRVLQQFCKRVRGPVKSVAYREPYNASKGIYFVWIVGGSI